MASDEKFFADELDSLGRKQEGKEVDVELSKELAPLLSEQLYRSPLKAIEELVVNSYDADAETCRLFVPSPSDQERKYILVYDDGEGMDEQGLEYLWQIGRSPKREKEWKKRSKRKQIGKFGIGKLATYAIGYKLTYVSKTEEGILSVSVDFRSFERDNGKGEIHLPVIEIDDADSLTNSDRLSAAMEAAGVSEEDLTDSDSWTIALLEDFKPGKGKKLQIGPLKRVLSTAMPLKPDFNLYLNCDEVRSSKENLDRVVEFNVSDLPEKRIDELESETGESWEIRDGALYSDSFSEGITGEVFVTGKRKLKGKSDDLSRSHGFFVRVRGRLINEDDALFGLSPRSYKHFNRMRAEINADDLDQILTAPREGVVESHLKNIFQKVLSVIFNEARQRRTKWEKEKENSNRTNNEESRNFVNPSLVEYPVADALVAGAPDEPQSDADRNWFYLVLDEADDKEKVINDLYGEDIETASRRNYNYEYKSIGRSDRLVKFNPVKSLFTINTSHEFVREHYDEDATSPLLEDVVTAEALLEIYLRENDVPSGVVGDVLERRDTLLRSLAKDRPYSLSSLAQELRDASGNQYDLEIAQVSAARRLGLVAKHISGAGEPDGIARFNDFAEGEKTITLEAKSSDGTPDLSSFDFAGLREHMSDRKADGCMLVAPDYPGRSKENDSAAAKRAQENRISCWTVELLANFVESAEKHHITAKDVIDIVTSKFTPDDVEQAVKDLLSESKFRGRDVYRAIIEELERTKHLATTKSRSLDFIHRGLLDDARFSSLSEEDLRQALKELAFSSQGAIKLRDDRIIVRTSIDELQRRVRGLTRDPGTPRRPSQLRSGSNRS